MNNTKREMFLIISSFLMGGLFMFFIGKSLISKETIVIEKSSLAPIIDQVKDSVVEVQIEGGNGSGFVYKTEGKYAYIITNEHVLKKDKVTIVFSNDKEVEGTILGKDEYLDIAVLQVPKKEIRKIATIGSIGSPLGSTYRGTVTAGIISGLDRFVSFPNEELDQNIGNREIQIDAPVNQGDSGGPLFNSKGEVIGVVSLKLTDVSVEGIGFAIPIDDVLPYLETIEKGETIQRPVLGIGMANLEDTATLLKYDIDILNDLNYGVAITSVKEDSNAQGYLQKGDIILEVDQNKIRNKTQLRYEVMKHQIGDTIEIKVLRDGKEKTITLKLEEK